MSERTITGLTISPWLPRAVICRGVWHDTLTWNISGVSHMGDDTCYCPDCVRRRRQKEQQ